MPNGFTGFDIIVFAIIGLSTVLAFARGFTTVALSFASWVGALLAVIFGYALVQPYARAYISPVELADFTAIGGLFLIALIVLRVIANQVGSAVKDSPVGFLDRSLGALFGFLRGAVVVSVAYLILVAVLRDDQPDWIADAKSRPLVAWGADVVSALAEDAFGSRPEGALDNARQQALDAAKSISEDVAETYTQEARKKLDSVIEDAVNDAQSKADNKDDETR